MACKCLTLELNDLLKSLAKNQTDQELLQSLKEAEDLPELTASECFEESFVTVSTLEECKTCQKCLINIIKSEAQKRGLIDDNLTKIVVVASVATAFGLLFAVLFQRN